MPHAKVFSLPLQTLEKLFSRDWARACGKEKFTSMLARENKGNAAGKSDKAAMQEVHDTLKKHYQVHDAGSTPASAGTCRSLAHATCMGTRATSSD